MGGLRCEDESYFKNVEDFCCVYGFIFLNSSKNYNF